MSSMNWIKVRDDLHEDPAILKIADRMNVREEVVVGYCVRFWSWASRNSTDGHVRNVSTQSVERVLNMPGFLDHLMSVGWLDFVESGDGTMCIVIPKFERHLSASAKQRCIWAEQKRGQRAAK